MMNEFKQMNGGLGLTVDDKAGHSGHTRLLIQDVDHRLHYRPTFETFAATGSVQTRIFLTLSAMMM